MHHAERKALYYPVAILLLSRGERDERPGCFKIANSNGDIQTMRDYARIIRTLQLQMGIPGTIFDDYIFDQGDQREFCVESPGWKCHGRNNSKLP